MGPLRKYLKLNEVTMVRPQFHSISVLMRRDVTELGSPHPSTERRSSKHSEPTRRGIRLCRRERRTASPTRACRTWAWTSPASRTARNLLLNPRRLCYSAAAGPADRYTRAERSRGRVWGQQQRQELPHQAVQDASGPALWCTGAASEKALWPRCTPAELLST